jgi:general secretion pathway protein I
VNARNTGFTLIEIVVAFAIAALSITALMRIFSNALDITHRAGGVTQATLIAQSKLAAVGGAIPLLDGSQSGDDVGGAYRWELTISSFEPPIIASPDAPVALAPLTLPLEMKQIEAVVRYGEPERTVKLVTFRTQPKKQ